MVYSEDGFLPANSVNLWRDYTCYYQEIVFNRWCGKKQWTYIHTHHLHTHWILQTLNPWVSMIVHCYTKPFKQFFFFCTKDSIQISVLYLVQYWVYVLFSICLFFLFNIMEFLNISVHFMSSVLECSNLINIFQSFWSFDCFEFQVLAVLISEQM